MGDLSSRMQGGGEQRQGTGGGDPISLQIINGAAAGLQLVADWVCYRGSALNKSPGEQLRTEPAEFSSNSQAREAVTAPGTAQPLAK